MTAQTLPLATAHGPALASATCPNVPIHGGDLGDASIVPLHVHGVTCPCPDCTRAHDQAFALLQLAAHLEEEGPSLARMLRLLDLLGARQILRRFRRCMSSLEVRPRRSPRLRCISSASSRL
jgi:hypothetical protein